MPEKKRVPAWLIVVIVIAVLAVFGMILNATGYKSQSQLEREQAATEQSVEEEQAPEPEPEPEEEQELSPSEMSGACIAIDRYGEQMYPYGFKADYFGGVQAIRPLGNDQWLFKVKCDITNEYGATAEGQLCDFTLQRSGDDWTVVGFMAY